MDPERASAGHVGWMARELPPPVDVTARFLELYERPPRIAEPVLLVAASPTRGLDVAGIETVHSYLREAATRGVGVLLISEDLDEILALADRVVVMYEGAVVGEREAERATVEEVGLLMAGGEEAR